MDVVTISHYKNLAAAIVLQAVSEYVSLNTRINRNPNCDSSVYVKRREIVDFFHSEWFVFLTENKISPRRLIETLNTMTPEDLNTRGAYGGLA